ncbi:hypothetical protein F5Y17DRAFT_349973 [Xylariaceae sp. FL0594]|nr:hypothetical protein F5Y17DRAFT_349973 [Xylariaceae sp. FL0594]
MKSICAFLLMGLLASSMPVAIKERRPDVDREISDSSFIPVGINCIWGAAPAEDVHALSVQACEGHKTLNQ